MKEQDLQVLSDLISRKMLAGKLGYSFGGDRNMYEILGYPTDLTFDDFYAKYKRQDVSGKIVDLPAQDTWRKAPLIVDGDSDTSQDAPTSAFIQAMKMLIEKKRLWHYLQRVDRLAGIGKYGVLVIGVRGGAPLSQPVAGNLRSVDDILYLSPFNESAATLNATVTDPNDARYGLPESYKIRFQDSKPAEVVHWSRVLHVADDLLEDEVYGRPRLERVYNRLDDLEKIAGGGSEATWKVMDRGLQADVRDGFTGEGQSLTDLEAEIDEYLHGLRRFIRTMGVDIKELGSTVVDPTGLYNILMGLIAAASDIPQRILTGSERGELASSQDQATWAGSIAARQTQFAEPQVLRPFLDRLIGWGALPRPTNGNYLVKWTSLFEMTEMEKAQTMAAYAGAVATVSPAGAVDMVINPQAFVEKWLGQDMLADQTETEMLDEEDAMDDGGNDGSSDGDGDL
jgi:hypothetical protein